MVIIIGTGTRAVARTHIFNALPEWVASYDNPYLCC
jgi:hypothetical protein